MIRYKTFYLVLKFYKTKVKLNLIFYFMNLLKFKKENKFNNTNFYAIVTYK